MFKRKIDQLICNNNLCSVEGCESTPLYMYEHDEKTYCEIHKKHKLIIHNSSDTIDLLSIQQWDGSCDIDKCKECKASPFSTTYEVNWIIRCTNERKYCSEMCHKCLVALAKLDPDIQSEKYRNDHPSMNNIANKYGLIQK